MIDLHTHTTASDGRLSPTALVARAKGEGITVLAVTDHDTTSGLAEACEAAGDREACEAAGGSTGIEIIPGIEISVDYAPGTFHMLGLFIDPADPALSAELVKVIEGRNARNRIIAEKLNRRGVPLRLADVLEAAGDGTVGRPHFARVMIDMRAVRDLNAAFTQYLAKGAPAYAERYRTGRERAIELIHGAGGVAVLCHPHTLGLGEGPDFREYVGELADLGLDALEAHYGEYKARDRERYLQVAADLGLLVSGGSDFHADTWGDRRRLSSGRSGIPVPMELLTPLRERAAQHRDRS